MRPFFHIILISSVLGFIGFQNSSLGGDLTGSHPFSYKETESSYVIERIDPKKSKEMLLEQEYETFIAQFEKMSSVDKTWYLSVYDQNKDNKIDFTEFRAVKERSEKKTLVRYIPYYSYPIRYVNQTGVLGPDVLEYWENPSNPYPHFEYPNPYRPSLPPLRPNP
jgi:hypothetical protein